MEHQKVQDVLSRLPEVYRELAGQKIKLSDGSQAIIKCRVNNLTKKPPLYMWNLTRSCYVSSLKKIQEDQGLFMFDVRAGENTEAYKLMLVDGEIKTERLNIV